MATIKAKDIRNMNKNEREKKLKELKMELIKSRSGNSKTTNRTREIKKIIARILTFNKPIEEKSSGGVENK
jgi:ribosomal protein L29